MVLAMVAVVVAAAVAAVVVLMVGGVVSVVVVTLGVTGSPLLFFLSLSALLQRCFVLFVLIELTVFIDVRFVWMLQHSIELHSSLVLLMLQLLLLLKYSSSS